MLPAVFLCLLCVVVPMSIFLWHKTKDLSQLPVKQPAAEVLVNCSFPVVIGSQRRRLCNLAADWSDWYGGPETWILIGPRCQWTLTWQISHSDLRLAPHPSLPSPSLNCMAFGLLGSNDTSSLLTWVLRGGGGKIFIRRIFSWST